MRRPRRLPPRWPRLRLRPAREARQQPQEALCRSPPRVAAHLVLLLLLVVSRGWPSADAFVLHSVEQRPTYEQNASGAVLPVAPIITRLARLSKAGEDPGEDSSIKMSRFTYVGCFQHAVSITTSALFGIYRDPNDCIEECKSQEIYADVPLSQIVVAVHNDPEQGRCGCALKHQMTDFAEEEEGANSCTYRCRDYLNPYCGGYPDYWGIFMSYDSFSMSGQGAYDPWRYVWYQLVVFKEASITGRYPPDGELPERYYLHACDTTNGKSRYEFHMRVSGGILYGLQYDIDSTRLVSLYTNTFTGRLRGDMPWQYKLATILINTTNQYRPYMQLALAPIDITEPREAVPEAQIVSDYYMGYNGASAIFSKDTNCFVFTQVHWSALKNQMKDRVYIVRIPDGFIIREEPIDFKITALYSNQMYGDLSGIGPRLDTSVLGGRQTYAYFGRVYRSTVESRTLVDWEYNPINPKLLADPGVIGDWALYPGVADSEHLFNKSAIAFRFKTEADPWGVMTIAEIGIRPPYLNTLWCNATTATSCQGTMMPDIPYSAIFNREPGIPLTLKAPSFVSPARFNMDASAITVTFDRSTLQGARQIDNNGDFVPDELDLTLQRQTEFDCGELFTVETTWKLGPWPETTCLWKTNAEVRISIAYVNISVGDTIYILPDALYAVNVDNQWSPAATGGVQIGLPDPLEYPVIIPSGSVKIDQCTPVRLEVDSLLDGGLASWIWSWIPAEEGAPNPEDLANRVGWEFDPIKLQTLKDFLIDATENNNKSLQLPSNLLEEASAYRIKVSITSRWNLTTNYTFDLEKLTFPAPTVYIEGPPVIYRNRTQNVALVAIGEKSECAEEDVGLAYRWLVSYQEYQPTGLMLDWADYPDITTTGAALIIPPEVLEPTPEELYNTYNFTIECYVDSEFGDVPEKTAVATISVKVPQSPILVQMSSYDRMLTITDVLVLDATSTLDPDYPPASDELTFTGTFMFKCLTPEPERAPCWDTRRLSKLGRPVEMTSDGFIRFPQAASERGVTDRRLQATDGFVPQSAMTVCRQDIGSKFTDGGKTYYTPLFDNLDYCSYARGILMVQTLEFIPGVYKFTIRAVHYDGRVADLDVFVEMVMQRVPRMTLSFVDPLVKFPVTREIKIKGSEEGEPSDVPRTYSWQFFVYEPNPAYNAELAEAALNDPENPYTIDEYIFADKTGILYDANDPMQFEASSNSPNLVIRANTLGPSNKYKIRLNVNLATVSGFAELGMETAGLAPRNGLLVVEPREATFDADRTLSAPDWKADDSPLTYEFGYYFFAANSDEPTLLPFSAAPSQVTKFEVSSIPLGTQDDNGNYTVPLFVQVCTPFNACTVQTQVVISNPPEDVGAAAANLLQEAEDMDATEMMNTYDAALSVAGDNLTVQSMILEGLTAEPMSADAASVGKAASMLAKMVDSGANLDDNLGEAVTGALEGLVVLAADNDLFKENEAIATSAFSAMGGLLPGANDMLDLDASGQSVSIGMRRAPNSVSVVAANWAARSGNGGDADLVGAAVRQRVNHPLPTKMWNAIEDCPSAFCDVIGLWCFPNSGAHIRAYMCCSSKNPNTLCDEPPCWFGGNKCPNVAAPALSPPSPSPSASMGSSIGSGTAASGLSNERRLQPAAASSANATHSSRKVRARKLQGRRRPNVATGGSGKFPAKALPQQQLDKRLPQQRGETWFDSWVDYNFPNGAPDRSEVSEYNRVRAFHGWHPNTYERRLEFMLVNDTVSVAVRLQALEDAELPLVRQAQTAVKQEERTEVYEVLEDSEQQLSFDMMSPTLAAKLKAENAAAELDAAALKMQSDRNDSQRITRIIVMRDTIAKSIIASMVPNERPKVFTSLTFRLTIGKTPDLTNVHPDFEFPEPYFKRPPDSPDEPTPLRPLTGFSYVYVEYFTNIYAWSESNPVSNETAMVTLIALQANTKDLDLPMVDPPIKMFKQFDLYSNAKCLYWDRFAPNTAGGAWSTKGVMNDGDSCITTHLSDVAVFIDGDMPSGHSLVDAATSWNREVWESHCIGCDSGSNLFPITALGMFLFTNMLLIILGYVQDERRRSEMKKNKVKSRYYYDGDGLTTPLNVDDPIAYAMRDVNLMSFWIGTFVNVLMREHAIIGTVFYHETFTRPQRMICFTAMMCGLLAVNAAVHSNPGYLQQAKEYIISGVLSGLLIFPIFCGLLMMFNLRPSQVKKRLIKRTYSTREMDVINEQRQKIAHQTSMMPEPGYMKRPPPPPGSIPGQTTLLSLPAPLPLPPLPPGQPGRTSQFALPPPLPVAGAVGASGMLALPSVPGMTANMPAPPPPRYPPPPKNAKVPSPATLMPPLNWPKVGPPPMPFPALQAPDASVGGTYTNLPMLGASSSSTPPDTGATPLQLTDTASLPGAVNNMLDTEAASPPRAAIKEDMSHGMVPPGMPPTNDMPGSMPGSSGDLPEPQNAPGILTPPMPATPKSASGGAGLGMGMGFSPAASSRPSLAPGPPLPAVQPPTQLLPRDAVPPPLFIRGGPPKDMPSPFAPVPAGPSGLSPWQPQGIPPPGFTPPVPSAFMGSRTVGLPGAPPPPNFPPAPPPPPREDDQAFVRRIKLTYMDKVTREHDKYDLLEDYDELGKDIPFWVFDTLTLMPYLAACTFTIASIFVVMQYGVKFQSWQEEYWLKGTLVGLIMILGLLELFRIVMMTLVELRKFENRRKAKAGHFLPRRVARPGDNFQAAPPPRLWKRAVAPPQVPKGKAPQPPARPAFLPKADMPQPKALNGGVSPPSIGPPSGMPGGSRIPVAPARPPVFSAAAMAQVGALDEPPAPATPHSLSNNPRMGFRTPPLPGTPSQGTPRTSGGPSPNMPPARVPILQSAGDLAAARGESTPGPPSPAHSTHSLSSMRQSLNQQVKAGRHAEAPPPPPAQPGAAPSAGVAPPPAPNAPPPSYSRPPSRPTSANSVPKPPPPRP
mmetsp:Transcript_107183/g.277272  ORF Transcript_107183/g.277272 Transcript_107183/m.277272 type:complete len:2939 (-) Transcript_107183:99-8915(-)